MAVLKSITNGNFNTSTTWAVVDSLSFNDTRSGTVQSTTNTSPSFSCNTSTIQGILLQLAYVTSPPSGTIKVDLLNASTSAVLGSTLINANDLPLSNNVGFLGWTYFPFSGGSVSVVAGTGYQIRTTASAANSLFFYYTNATNNISKGLVTTTTQAAATNDILIVCGSYTGVGTNFLVTVTMDNTGTTNTYSTIYVDTKGKLSYGTNANTNYFLRTNNVIYLRGKGELEIGNSSTRIPSTSTALLEFSGAAINTVGISIQGGTLTAYGNPVTTRTKLNNNVTVGGTVLTATTTTNWKNGDLIVLPSTTRTNTQIDVLRLTADSVGNILNVTPVVFAHDGSIESIYNTDIPHFSRNIKMYGTSTTAPFYKYVFGYNSIVNLDYVEMFNVGGTNTSLSTAYVLAGNTTSGSTSITNSSYWYTGATLFTHVYINSQSLAPYHTYRFANNNIYNFFSGYVDVGANQTGAYSATVISDNIFVRTPVDQRRLNTVFSGNVITSAGGSGLAFNTVTTGVPWFVINNANYDSNVMYSNSSAGLSMGYFGIDRDITIKNMLCFRNNAGGISNSGGPIFNTQPSVSIGAPKIIFLSAITFGNATAGLYIQQPIVASMLFQDSYFFLGTTFTQPSGVVLTNTVTTGLDLYNCRFGLRPYGLQASSLTTNISQSNSFLAKINAYNCIYSGGSMPINNSIFSYEPNGVSSMNHNQVIGDHRMYQYAGTITTDTVIYSASSPSIRLTPATATSKAWTVPQKVPVSSGATCTVSVLVRKSVVGDGTAYNGSQPRLIVKKNYLGGIMSDTLLTTGTTANGIWETLQGTTPIVNSDCVLEFYVDCDGTTGWINVDKWSSTTNNDTREMRYWFEGSPYVEIDYSVSSGSGGEKSFVFVG